MNLADTETLFTASLEPRCSTPQRTRALHLIRKDGSIPPELALRIYGNNVSGARVKSLAATYPACFRILGEACFNSIAQRFIEHTPSEQPDLNYYGATLSDFLDDWTATREQFSDYRYLGDLARLEWLCHTAYYAEDDPPFDFTAFARACQDVQETLRFRLGHSVGLLQSEYPVVTIREVNLSEGDASEVQAGELPAYLVVSRPTYQPHVERVDEVTFQLLAACREGKTLGHIVDTCRQRAEKVAGTLPGLIRRGWITGVTVDRTCTPGGY
jgi:hypothetical protein